MSMVSMLSFMEKWSASFFAEYMGSTGTHYVELVPSFVLGPSWHEGMVLASENYQDMIKLFTSRFSVLSIQSLLFGVDIQLGSIPSHLSPLESRFQALSTLGRQLGCSRFILGSPSSRRLVGQQPVESAEDAFLENCSLMASYLDPDQILSLEHNTFHQGAEFMNTLESIHHVVRQLRRNGIQNVGINLDTKCVLNQFGPDCDLGIVLSEGIRESISSIQVSYDFLKLSNSSAGARNLLAVSQIAQENSIAVSLEEYGLRLSDSSHYVSLFREYFDCDRGSFCGGSATHVL